MRRAGGASADEKRMRKFGDTLVKRLRSLDRIQVLLTKVIREARGHRRIWTRLSSLDNDLTIIKRRIMAEVKVLRGWTSAEYE